MHVVWLKRDLRARDHRPLVEAAARGEVLCLYVYEPELFRASELGSLHLQFINESLAALREELRAAGADLTVRVGTMPEVLEELHRRRSITALYSHRETGNRVTYDRDLRVRAWTEQRGVPWHEWNQYGVIRRLGSRDGWAARWARFMSKPVLDAPSAIRSVSGIAAEGLRSPTDLGLAPCTQREIQRGGEGSARSTLASFLAHRGAGYRDEMSSPLVAWYACSRLSPHLAWGNISLRTVYQQTRARSADLKELRKEGVALDSRWLQSLSSFQSRLRWHCHFIQKLEDEPDLEFRALNRELEGLRDEARDERFEAWAAGKTGYPMVDACMRALLETGWLNFRMRAMLMSFASYQLWLPWRRSALHLAKHFLDFEPGIHFSQAQMQSGITGINAVRIYSPIKQVYDQDPEGRFIKRYVPELAGVPASYIAEPHRMSASVQAASGCIIGRHYPAPIVHHSTAYAEARRRIHAARRTPEARKESERVYAKHGSRRRPRRPPPKGATKPRRESAVPVSSRTP